jgi:hypothetical protein
MSSLAIRLPLVRENGDGFRTIKSFRSLIKQNFKMLLLTNPGERVMEPDYGVGIKKFLFENFDESTFSRVETNILEQVNIYMQEIESSPNGLQIKIAYSIPDIAVQDLLEFTI